MNNGKLKFLPLDSKTLEIQWPEKLSQELCIEVIASRELLSSMLKAELLDAANTYNTICLFFNTPQDWSIKIPVVEAIADTVKNRPNPEQSPVDVPVKFETSVDNNDFEQIMDLTKMETDKIIELFLSVTYTVVFTGFLPGFPYLIGLPNALHLPRKAQPSKRIAAGSVAIAGKQAGIYPQDSPGGWYVLGRTSFTLFQVMDDQPRCLRAGDRIRFYPVNSMEEISDLMP
jgi:inhibitor of KinA